MKDNRSFHCAFHLYTTPPEVSRAIWVNALEYCHHPPGRPFGNIILKADRDLDRQAVKPACFTRMSARFRIRPLYYPLKGLIMIPAGHRATFYGLRPPTRAGADATVHGRQKLVKCTGNPVSARAAVLNASDSHSGWVSAWLWVSRKCHIGSLSCPDCRFCAAAVLRRGANLDSGEV